MAVHCVSPKRRAEIEAEQERERKRVQGLIDSSKEYFRSIGREDIIYEIDHPEQPGVSKFLDFIDGVLDLGGIILRSAFYGLAGIIAVKFIFWLLS